MLLRRRRSLRAPRDACAGRARVVFAHERIQQHQGPEGDIVFRAFVFVGVHAMTLSRDWWAVIVAVTAAVLVKLGLIAGVPW
jgi:hypothetical protein